MGKIKHKWLGASATTFLLLLIVFATFETKLIYAQKARKQSQEKVATTFDNLTHLKDWIGRYPINPKSKKYHNFFKLPEVKARFVGVLRSKGLSALMKEFQGQVPIEEIEGFLVIYGTGPKLSLEEGFVTHMLVALKLEDDETHVVFVQGNKNWAYSTTSESLPEAIEKKIHIYQFGYKSQEDK